MIVLKFYVGEYYYGYAAETVELAIERFHEEISPEYDRYEEIPESEWDEPSINIWDDNDFDSVPFKVSIREEILCGSLPQMIFTNDMEIIG